MDEPQVDQQYEDVEFYHITICPEECLHQERSEHVNTIVIEHFNSILFQKSETTNKQHTDQSIKLKCIVVLSILILRYNMLY